MWYEIVPCVGIITAAVTFPTIFAYFSHKLVQNGNPYRRDVTKEAGNTLLYARDIYRGGNPYVRKGLENIQ